MSEESRFPMLHLSVGPYIRHGETVTSIMLWVVGALVPAVAASCYFFGIQSLLLIGSCIAACIATEGILSQFLFKQSAALLDCSAIVTGLLLALSLPPRLPIWMAILGSVFAMALAKWLFGGLGNNIVNPAMAGRAFLMLSFPAVMIRFVAPLHGTISGLEAGIDGIAQATPLTAMRAALASGRFEPLVFQDALGSLFFGTTGGCIGETSAAALILGAIILWYKRIIGFSIPFTFIGSAFLLFWLFNGTGTYFTSEAAIVPVYQILSGGFLLAAFFIATEPVTSPITAGGRVIFGLGCGIITFCIRRFGSYPEGVCFAVLLMNLTTPLIDRWVRPRPFGKAVAHV
jgi:electron transport complex protein RnfD